MMVYTNSGFTWGIQKNYGNSGVDYRLQNFEKENESKFVFPGKGKITHSYGRYW